MVISTKARTLKKIKDIRIIMQDIIVPTTLHLIEFSNNILLLGTDSGTKDLKSYKEKDVYSNSGDTFDKFDYEKEKFNEFEEEDIKNNPVLYLTNIKEVSTKEDEKDNNKENL
ncbi:1579_t:CDS:2, partial [Gigaspora margarita]